MGVLECVRNQVPLELAKCPVIILPASMPRLEQIIEQAHECIGRDSDSTGRIEGLISGVKIMNALDLSRVAAAVVVNLHGDDARLLELTSSLRQILTDVFKFLAVVTLQRKTGCRI